MKWTGRRQSGNIEDRRGFSGGGLAVGGGIGGLIIYLLVNFVFGGDSSQLVNPAQEQRETAPNGVTATKDAQEDQMAKFASVVLADNEDVWKKLFRERGMNYAEPVMVLFRDRTSSACGSANSATGPFYCPSDQKVYLDLSFFSDLKNRFGASGDFANAYVIAHEVGHHVQNLLGTASKVHNAMSRMSERDRNRLSVAMELQADFYAGVWAHHDQQINNALDQGDIEEALSAANAIGDDRLQKMSRGEVVPDAFTHGTSAERMHWFKKGYDTGDMTKGTTFESLEN
jgi:uncharacterized protein